MVILNRFFRLSFCFLFFLPWSVAVILFFLARRVVPFSFFFRSLQFPLNENVLIIIPFYDHISNTRISRVLAFVSYSCNSISIFFLLDLISKTVEALATATTADGTEVTRTLHFFVR